MICHQNKGVHN